MSLDVYLESEPTDEPCRCAECGHEHTRKHVQKLYHANITHNLNSMAIKAGIYQCVWRPDENEITKAKQLIKPLTDGIILLRSDPERFKKFNPSNGWGSYEDFISFLLDYRGACQKYPTSTVKVSR